MSKPLPCPLAAYRASREPYAAAIAAAKAEEK